MFKAFLTLSFLFLSLNSQAALQVYCSGEEGVSLKTSDDGTNYVITVDGKGYEVDGSDDAYLGFENGYYVYEGDLTEGVGGYKLWLKSGESELKTYFSSPAKEYTLDCVIAVNN